MFEADAGSSVEDQSSPEPGVVPRDKPRRVSPPTEHARQKLKLFQTFYAPAEQVSRLSNVIDVWDAAPKYSTPCRSADVTDCAAMVLSREFRFRGENFRVAVAPGIFHDMNGSVVARLPTSREELIEDVLRKIAVDQRLGLVGTLDNRPIAGVRFSLSMVRRELAKYGHGIKYPDLVESLMIMSASVVTITYAGHRTALHRSTILSNLGACSRLDFLRDPETLWSAHFHPMVVDSLSAVSYRQYDYAASMSYRSSLSRWLHKYLSATFLNAGITHPCRLRLSEIRQASGLVNRATIRHQALDVERAIGELRDGKAPIVRLYERSDSCDGRKIADAVFTLYPSAEFVRLVVASNKRHSDGQSSIASSWVAPAIR